MIQIPTMNLILYAELPSQNIGLPKDLRQKLGLLIVENEKQSVGLLRIATDQARRTEVRSEAQRRMSKPKKVKVPREKKPKAPPKPRVKAHKKAGTKTKPTVQAEATTQVEV